MERPEVTGEQREWIGDYFNRNNREPLTVEELERQMIYAAWQEPILLFVATAIHHAKKAQ